MLNDDEIDFLNAYDINYRPKRACCRRENVLFGLVALNTCCLFSLIIAVGFVITPAYEMRQFWQKHRENFVKAAETLQAFEQIKDLIMNKLIPVLCSTTYTRKYLGPKWCHNKSQIKSIYATKSSDKTAP